MEDKKRKSNKPQAIPRPKNGLASQSDQTEYLNALLFDYQEIQNMKRHIEEMALIHLLRTKPKQLSKNPDCRFMESLRARAAYIKHSISEASSGLDETNPDKIRKIPDDEQVECDQIKIALKDMSYTYVKDCLLEAHRLNSTCEAHADKKLTEFKQKHVLKLVTTFVRKSLCNIPKMLQEQMIVDLQSKLQKRIDILLIVLEKKHASRTVEKYREDPDPCMEALLVLRACMDP